MSWWGGGEIKPTPGVECLTLAIFSSTLWPGSCPPSPGFAPWLIFIWISLAFTWGSVIFISLSSYLFQKNIYTRIIGVLSSSLVFYIISNFGVWSLGSYGYSLDGLLICYIAAIPFYTNTLISTILYSVLIESTNLVYKKHSLT